MVGMLAIVAAAGWLLIFAVCAMVTALPPVRAGAAAPWPQPAGERPALVNLAVTGGRLDGAAYAATILDLAAKGHLLIAQRMPGRLWCDVPAAAPPDTGLAGSERLVLGGARRLAGGVGAPFEAVAESCASDVAGRWVPFERAVRAEGRQAGITRSRLPAAVQIPLYAGAAVVGGLAFAAIQAVPHSGGVWTPLVVALVAVMALASWVGGFSRRDRLTGYGSARGAWAARVAADAAVGRGQGPVRQGPVPTSSPAELGALALAVAAGASVQVPGASPGLAARVRPGRGRARADHSVQSAETPRPAVAWSSLGGQWRLVRIGSATRMPPGLWLAVAAWLALLTYGASLLPSPFGLLLPVLLVTGAAAAGVAGVRGLAARFAKPAEASFRGQVIARWVERNGDNDSDRDVSCIAVDDGERAWSFEVSHIAFGKMALGDTVAVRASPRSGKLLALRLEPDVTDRDVTDRGAADRGAAAPGRAAVDLMDDGNPFRVTPGRPGPLLTAEEVTAAVGRPVQATGWRVGVTGAVYRGAGFTVTLTVAERALGGLSSGVARRWGQPLPGIGDEAWLLARDRTIVFRVGTHTGKITISSAAAPALPPDAVTGLAAAFAGRLAEAVGDQEPSDTPPPRKFS